MIVGFSEDEMSLRYSTENISGWTIDHKPSKVSLHDIFVLLHMHVTLFSIFTDIQVTD